MTRGTGSPKRWPPGWALRVIATGHTADDVAETVLMNLARGTGLRGLAGIPPVRGEVQRPLIGCTRREILDYLREIDQPYRTDPTNLTGKYARNRVRLEVLPVLEELYPAAAGNIARAASLVREDLEVLEELATGTLERRGEEVVLPLDELMNLRPALRRHAVRLAYATVVPDTAPLPSNLIEAVLELLEGGEGTRTLDLPGGVVASGRSGEELAFYRGPRPWYRDERRSGPERRWCSGGGGSRRGRSLATIPRMRRAPRWPTSMPETGLTGCGWRGRGILSGRWASVGPRRFSGR